jgi:hypothetical protein
MKRCRGRLNHYTYNRLSELYQNRSTTNLSFPPSPECNLKGISGKMPLQTTFDQVAGIIQVCSIGEVQKSDHLAAWGAAVQLSREVGCRKLLVDLHNLHASTLTIEECFSFGEMVAASQDIDFIAHVLPSTHEAREHVQFASTVEANRGKNTEEFETADDARNWLIACNSRRSAQKPT